MRSKCIARVIFESRCYEVFAGNVSVVMRSGIRDSVRIIGRRYGCVVLGRLLVSSRYRVGCPSMSLMYLR